MRLIGVVPFISALALMVGGAMAKLPAPSDEAKAKSAEAAAKAAHGGKVGAYQLCKVQDRVAANYHARVKKASKPAGVGPAMAPCADPGPFVYKPEGAAAPAPAPVAVTPKK